MTESVFSMAGAILMVASILGLAWWFSRLVGRGYGKAIQGQRLKVVEQLRIGQDQRLLLVSFKDRGFLIGAGPAGIQLLTEVELDSEEDFSARLKMGGTGNE